MSWLLVNITHTHAQQNTQLRSILPCQLIKMCSCGASRSNGIFPFTKQLGKKTYFDRCTLIQLCSFRHDYGRGNRSLFLQEINTVCYQMTSNGTSCFEFGQELKKKRSMICISFRLHNRSFFLSEQSRSTAVLSGFGGSLLLAHPFSVGFLARSSGHAIVAMSLVFFLLLLQVLLARKIALVTTSHGRRSPLFYVFTKKKNCIATVRLLALYSVHR